MASFFIKINILVINSQQCLMNIIVNTINTVCQYAHILLLLNCHDFSLYTSRYSIEINIVLRSLNTVLYIRNTSFRSHHRARFIHSSTAIVNSWSDTVIYCCARVVSDSHSGIHEDYFHVRKMIPVRIDTI